MRISQTLAFVGYRAMTDALGKAAFFAIMVLAARRLTPSAFGLVALGTTAGWIAAVLSDFGIGTYLARETARCPSMRATLLREWLTLRIRLAAAVLFVVAFVLLVLGISPGSSLVIALLVATYAASGILESACGFFRGISRSDLESTLTFSQRAAQLAGAAAVLVWRPDPALLALALLVPAVATSLVGLQLAQGLAGSATTNVERGTANVERGTPNDERRTQNAARRTSPFWSDVAPIGVGIVLSALYFRLDVLLLEWWQGLEAVAHYNAVFRLIEGLRLFPAAVLAVVLPSLARATTSGPVMRLSAALMVSGVLAAIALALVADWLIVTAYGQAYASAIPAFRILLLAFPLMSLNYALTTQLVAWNGQRAFAALCGTALIFNLAANARLIPSLSIVGAAWTTVATEVLLTVGSVAALTARSASMRPAAHAALNES